MIVLTPEQTKRAAVLLEMIVRPDFTIEGDRRSSDAIEEAQRLFGYYVERKRQRGQRSFYGIHKPKTTLDLCATEQCKVSTENVKP